MKSTFLTSARRQIGANKMPLTTLLLTIISSVSRAQTGNGAAGLQQANQLVGSYFDYGVTLLYSVGAIVGLVGAVKVYNAWSHGDQQTNKLAASWFGACIFLVIVAAVLKSFFGVS